MLGKGLDEVPGIDGDAVAADSGPGLENMNARVEVGVVDRLPDVDGDVLGDTGKDVGQRDVHIAVGVLHQLAHLGGAIVGKDKLALGEAS